MKFMLICKCQQFSSGFYSINSRWDLSPVTVKATQYKENIYHFLIQICAIIGGIFTVTGIIDSLVHESVSAILKKANMGKLT